MKSITVTREDLHKEVWSTPITSLAAKYHLSDVGFSKVCKKMNVPTPPRGYWAKINAGVKMKKQPLPARKEGTPIYHEFHIREKPKEKYGEALAEAEKMIDTLKPIHVPERLPSMHPHVRTSYNLLKKMLPDNYGVLRLNKEGYLNIRVGPKNLKRAMRILNALMKTFDSLGFKVKPCQTRYSTTCILINGEEVPFVLDERTTYTGYEPTDAERRKNRFRYRWDYEPTGLLYFRIDTWTHEGMQKKWSDTRHKSLEGQLNSIVAGIIRIAFIEKEKTRRRAEEKRRYEKEQRRIEEENRRYEEELRKQKNIENQASLWSQSQKLHSYIQAVKDTVLQGDLDEDTYKTFQVWLGWAREYADNLDPLKSLSIKSIIEHQSSAKEDIDVLCS